MSAAEILARSETPLIVAGHGVLRSDAVEEVRMLAEHLSAPVLTTFMANGILPPDHPLNLHTLGQPEETDADHALDMADLIVAIGFDPVEYAPSALTREGSIPVLCVSETVPDASHPWQLEGVLAGALQQSVSRLSVHLEARAPNPHFTALRARIAAEDARSPTPDGGEALAPEDVCRVLTDTLRPDDTLLSGVGLHKLWLARNLRAQRPGQVIIPNGLAGMGLALPGAIAAARLRQGGRVFAICGDGDFLMNVQEMETARRLDLSLTVLIWEDGGYGLIDEKQPEADMAEREFAFTNPAWEDLARAFGWAYADIRSLTDLRPALEAFGQGGGPGLIRMTIDYELSGGMPG